MISAFLIGREPVVPHHSVCIECKQKGNICVMVAHGTPCLGPVTQAGCGALCPTFHRGCYGCFGPMESPNTASLASWLQDLGMDDAGLVAAFRGFNAWSDSFREASNRHEARLEIGGPA